MAVNPDWFERKGTPPARDSDEWDQLCAALAERMGRHICGAKSRHGWPCTRPPTRGRNRCNNHGGMTLSGPAHPSWKHGGRSYVVPRRLQEGVDRVMNDPDYLSLKGEIALAAARHQELLNGLSTGETGAAWLAAQAAYGDTMVAMATGEDPMPYLDNLRRLLDQGVEDVRKWDELRKNADHIRKLSNTERVRQEALAEYMTAEGGVAFVGTLLAMLKEVCTQEQLVTIMNRIHHGQLLRAAASQAKVSDLPVLGREVGRSVMGEGGGQ